MYNSNLYNNQKRGTVNTNLDSNLKNNNLFTSIEVIDELLNKFFKKSVDKYISFLIYHNMSSKNSCEKIMEIILSKFNFVKIDALNLHLYRSPLFFLAKKIIKNLPVVSYDDKKVLWERILVFFKSFNMKVYENYNKELSSETVFTEIEYDDPIFYVKKEIGDILRIYNINQTINIYINNLDVINYDFMKKIYLFVNVLFGEFVQFRFIAQAYKMQIAQNLALKYPGNNDYNELINFDLKNSYNYFVYDEINNNDY